MPTTQALTESLMYTRKGSLSLAPDQVLTFAIAVLKAIDEGDDLFKPGGFTRKNLVEAISCAYDAVAIAKPEIKVVPKYLIVQIAVGAMEFVAGIMDVIKLVER